MNEKKYLDESGLSRLIQKIKTMFAPLSHTHTKEDVGLGNVDNTSDSEKSVKYAENSGSAKKFASLVNIGHAQFDGTQSITLKDMGIYDPVEITKEKYNQMKEAGTLDENTYYNIIDDIDPTTLIDDSVQSTDTTYSSNKLETEFAKKEKLKTILLSSSNWLGDESPYSYTISDDNIKENSIIEVNYNSVSTKTDIKEYKNANFYDGGQTIGNFTIMAENKPSVDLKLDIIIRNNE